MSIVKELEEVCESAPPYKKTKSHICAGERVVMEILLGLLGLAGVALLVGFAGPLPSEADYKKALEKLGANPIDPDANTVAGKYLAFVTGDYSAAMPYLVHSADKTLSTLADHELDATYTDSPIKKVGMGDEWVVAAKKFPALNKIFYDRASQWYGLAWPDLDKVWKDKSRAQGLKLATARPQGGARKGVPVGWTTDTHPKGWQQPGFDGSISHDGSYSVKFPAADPKTPNSYTAIATDLIPISGKTLSIAAYVMSDGTESGQDHLEVRFYDATGKESQRVSVGLIPVDIPFWSRIKTSVNVPANSARVQFAVIITSKNGSVWVDDLELKVDGKDLVKQGFELK